MTTPLDRLARWWRERETRPRRCTVCRAETGDRSSFCSAKCAQQWRDDYAY